MPRDTVGVKAKETSLLNCNNCRAKVKIFSPSLAMVTSPNEWKILSSGRKNSKQIYKQTKQLSNISAVNRSYNDCKRLFKTHSVISKQTLGRMCKTTGNEHAKNVFVQTVGLQQT